MRKSLYLTLPILLALTGCFGPVKPLPINKYTLSSVPTTIPTTHKKNAILLVFSPVVKPVYNSTNMIYTEQPYKLESFVLNQWAKSPSEMLQPLIVESMLKSNHFKAVVGSPYVGHYTYGLNTQLFELQQDYTGKTPVLHLSMRAEIISSTTGNVIASKLFTVDEPILEKNPYAGVVAANKATEKMLTDLVVFSEKHT